MPWKFACLILVVTIIIYIWACATSQTKNPADFIAQRMGGVYTAASPHVSNIIDNVDQGMTLQGGTHSNNSMDRIMGTEGMTTTHDPDNASETESVRVAEYDPASQGGLKHTEIESHQRNMEERSPFATVGAARADSYIRDDDEYMRTGIPWVFRPPCRAYSGPGIGPQSGARQVNSESSASIASLNKMDACPSYNW